MNSHLQKQHELAIEWHQSKLKEMPIKIQCRIYNTTDDWIDCHAISTVFELWEYRKNPEPKMEAFNHKEIIDFALKKRALLRLKGNQEKIFVSHCAENGRGVATIFGWLSAQDLLNRCEYSYNAETWHPCGKEVTNE